MLSFQDQINWHQPLFSLRKFHKTITGLTSKHQIVQVDTRNHICEKVMSFINEDYEFPTIYTAKYLSTQISNDYYFTFQDRIVDAKGNIISQTNNKATFNTGLDAEDDFFIFSKFHKQHNKYSLNTIKIGQDKKIIKLYDTPFIRLNLICCGAMKSLAVERRDENIALIWGQNWEHQETIEKVNKTLFDYNYAYLLSSNEKDSSKKKSDFNSLDSQRQTHKVRVSAFQKEKLTKGKDYSSFQFTLHSTPLKIDSFQTDLLVAFENSFQIYDIRKLSKPFQKQAHNEIKDFFYDPNLQKIYLSSQKALQVYFYK